MTIDRLTRATYLSFSEYKTGMNSRTEQLLRERGSIHGVDHIADQLIAYALSLSTTKLEAFIWILLIRPRASSQAQEAREQLAGQRSLLQNTLVTLSGMRGTG
jgi:hypothetical protein